jgi:hypothetical protein
MSDDEQAEILAETEVQVGDEPTQKRYRRYHSVEFHDNLLVSVMIIVKAYGRVFAICALDASRRVARSN